MVSFANVGTGVVDADKFTRQMKEIETGVILTESRVAAIS
jgi:hypothetical protein